MWHIVTVPKWISEHNEAIACAALSCLNRETKCCLLQGIRKKDLTCKINYFVYISLKKEYLLYQLTYYCSSVIASS